MSDRIIKREQLARDILLEMLKHYTHPSIDELENLPIIAVKMACSFYEQRVMLDGVKQI
jgi:hypothetical protein